MSGPANFLIVFPTFSETVPCCYQFRLLALAAFLVIMLLLVLSFLLLRFFCSCYLWQARAIVVVEVRNYGNPKLASLVGSTNHYILLSFLYPIISLLISSVVTFYLHRRSLQKSLYWIVCTHHLFKKNNYLSICFCRAAVIFLLL